MTEIEVNDGRSPVDGRPQWIDRAGKAKICSRTSHLPVPFPLQRGERDKQRAGEGKERAQRSIVAMEECEWSIYSLVLGSNALSLLFQPLYETKVKVQHLGPFCSHGSWGDCVGRRSRMNATLQVQRSARHARATFFPLVSSPEVGGDVEDEFLCVTGLVNNPDLREHDVIPCNSIGQPQHQGNNT